MSSVIIYIAGLNPPGKTFLIALFADLTDRPQYSVRTWKSHSLRWAFVQRNWGVSDALILRSSAGGGLDFDSASYGGGGRAGLSSELFSLTFRIRS
jgi:hypothetical protein